MSDIRELSNWKWVLPTVLAAAAFFGFAFQSKVNKTNVSFASLVTCNRAKFDANLGGIKPAIEATLPYDALFIVSLFLLCVLLQLRLPSPLHLVWIAIAILAATTDGLEDVLLFAFAKGAPPSSTIFYLQYPKVLLCGLDVVGIVCTLYCATISYISNR